MPHFAVYFVFSGIVSGLWAGNEVDYEYSLELKKKEWKIRETDVHVALCCRYICFSFLGVCFCKELLSIENDMQIASIQYFKVVNNRICA